MSKVPGLNRDYVGEGRVRQACAEAGVLESAIEDFVVEFQAGLFTEESMAAHSKLRRLALPPARSMIVFEPPCLPLRSFAGLLFPQGVGFFWLDLPPIARGEPWIT